MDTLSAFDKHTKSMQWKHTPDDIQTAFVKVVDMMYTCKTIAQSHGCDEPTYDQLLATLAAVQKQIQMERENY
ncbi:MAG: hypothetical protein ACRDBG_24250 [Waterburya sp.]